MVVSLAVQGRSVIDLGPHLADRTVHPWDDANLHPAPDAATRPGRQAGATPQQQKETPMSQPKITKDSTPAFFGATVVFLGAVTLWNVVTLQLLQITMFERFTLGMGLLASMFAVMVLSKIIRDRADAQDLVNEVRAARYEEMLASSPAPGLGEL